MTVIVDDLKYPTGQVQETHFPGESLDLILSSWLVEAVSKASTVTVGQDDAIKDWVYYRAFSAVADRLASEPDSASTDGVARTLSTSRVQYFRNLANSHLDQFKTAFQNPQSTSKPSTTAVTTRVRF